MLRKLHVLRATILLIFALVVSPSRVTAQSAEVSKLINQSFEQYQRSKYSNALSLAHQALELAKKQHDHDGLAVGQALAMKAIASQGVGRLGEAESLYLRAIPIYERHLPPDNKALAGVLQNLGTLHILAGRPDKAEYFLKRSLPALGKAEKIGALLNLSLIYKQLGQFDRAELQVRKAITALAWQAPSRTLSVALLSLSDIYLRTGRYDESINFATRALNITKEMYSSQHRDVATSFHYLARARMAQGVFDAETEHLLRKSRDLAETITHTLGFPVILSSAYYYLHKKSYEEAYRFAKIGIRKTEIAGRVDAISRADLERLLGNILYQQKRYSMANEHLQAGLRLYKEHLAPDNPAVYETLHSLGSVEVAQRNWSEAAKVLRKATAILKRRISRSTRQTSHDGSYKSVERIGGDRSTFSLLNKVIHRLPYKDMRDRARLSEETFLLAQIGNASTAATSISQMAARLVATDGEGAKLIREQQDLKKEVRQYEDVELEIVSEVFRKDAPPPTWRLQGLTTFLGPARESLSKVNERLNNRLSAKKRQITLLPMNFREIQQLLFDDEALILMQDTPEHHPLPEETFLWLLTKTGVRWVRSEIGTTKLQREVEALRCGLDFSAWFGDGAVTCADRLGISVADAPEPDDSLPFDIERAHRLYKRLFGEIDVEIRGKKVLIVPSGALTALPLQVLVTEKPQQGADRDYASVSWLGQRNDITVLPSVASLKALRIYAKESKASGAFMGFGNPLLIGKSGTDRRAWDRQTCPEEPFSSRVLQVALGVTGKIKSFFRGGLARVEDVRGQAPLPETVDELCAVARASGADASKTVFLGRNATEEKVKQLSRKGYLAQARVVHFATHGLIAGETSSLAQDRAEPSLILTPPKFASEEDDGLLTASEVSTLRLDADWVVLSACNTAAGNTVGGDAFTGLARAFFYAGARSLLVSHWYVDSQATVSLIRKAFEVLKNKPKLGRAGALREAMTSLIAAGGRNAHPQNWAPFVLVGEGRAG